MIYPNLSRKGMACLLTTQKSKQPWGRTLLRCPQEGDGLSQPVNSNLLNHILLHLRITGTVCLTQREEVARLGSECKGGYQMGKCNELKLGCYQSFSNQNSRQFCYFDEESLRIHYILSILLHISNTTSKEIDKTFSVFYPTQLFDYEIWALSQEININPAT